jgi:hypothetical protein
MSVDRQEGPILAGPRPVTGGALFWLARNNDFAGWWCFFVLDLFFGRAMHIRRLIHFPYVLVRLQLDACKCAGSSRLARLAVKYGAEILLDDLLLRLSADCPWRMIRVSRVQNSFVGVEKLTDEEPDDVRALCERRAKREIPAASARKSNGRTVLPK